MKIEKQVIGEGVSKSVVLGLGRVWAGLGRIRLREGLPTEALGYFLRSNQSFDEISYATANDLFLYSFKR